MHAIFCHLNGSIQETMKYYYSTANFILSLMDFFVAHKHFLFQVATIRNRF